MRAFRLVGVLPAQVIDDSRLGPFEVFVFVARDQPGPLPLVVARNVLVDAQHEIQPAAEKQVAGGADGIRFEPPGLDAVGGPARRVVIAVHAFGPLLQPEIRVVLTVGARADKSVPVDGRPEGGVPGRQFVHDPRVYLAPGRSLVGHQQHRIAGTRQVEARIAQHRRRGVLVPPGMRLFAAIAPVVGRGRLLPQKAQPAPGALVVFGMQRGELAVGRRHRTRRRRALAAGEYRRAGQCGRAFQEVSSRSGILRRHDGSPVPR